MILETFLKERQQMHIVIVHLKDVSFFNQLFSRVWQYHLNAQTQRFASSHLNILTTPWLRRLVLPVHLSENVFLPEGNIVPQHHKTKNRIYFKKFFSPFFFVYFMQNFLERSVAAFPFIGSACSYSNLAAVLTILTPSDFWKTF